MFTPDQVFSWPGYFILLAIVSIGFGHRIPQVVTVDPESHNPKYDWVFSSFGIAMFAFIPLGIGFLVAGNYLSHDVRSGLIVEFNRDEAYRLPDDHLCVVENANLVPTARSDVGIMIDRTLSGQDLDYEPLTEVEAKAIRDLKRAERLEAEQYEAQDAIYKDAIEGCMKRVIKQNLASLDGRTESMIVWIWETDPYGDIR